MVLDTSVFSRPERLAAVRATGLLDTPPDPEFDRYTRLAAHASGTQLAVLTLFDARRQFFKSTFGRTPPWLDKRELPVQATLCQHTVREGQSVFVDDTREDPRMRELQIVRNREALAYAGVPLRSSALEIIGTLAVLQDRPRNWDQDVRKDLEELAQLAERDIARRVGVLGSPEAVYTSLFEHSPQPMLVYDVATLRILSVNEAAVAQYGWTRARMLGMTMEQIRPPEEVERFHENLACAPQGLHRAGIRIHQRHDGTRMIVDVTAHPVRFDGQDARLILVEDVTVRKGREDHLHMLEKAVEHLTDFVMVTEATPLDEPGPRIVFLNPAFEHITGWRNEDAVGRSPRFLQGPKTSRAALDRIRKALEAHMPVHEELLNYGPDRAGGQSRDRDAAFRRQRP
jgi:PAS domain S-box-containing protein